MGSPEHRQVVVQVVALDDGGRQIGWGSNVAETLTSRLEDVRAAIVSGAGAIAEGLPGLPAALGWQVKEVTGTFGLSLAAEAGVIISKASTEATFEVSVTFERTDQAG